MPEPRLIRDHVIVDGSNIATEGRTKPSLAQLEEAVLAFLDEYPGTRMTVVVDATFAHRIDAKERARYEEGVLAGEIVAPPAGAIGRGDAFITAAAHKADATILSNDSFQELHGEYPWLFDEGRLIGGKPVDGVGWVFVPRSPVRGPQSRRSQRGRGSSPSKSEKAKAAKAVEAEVAARRARGAKPIAAEATDEVAPKPARRKRSRGKGRAEAEQVVNDAARTAEVAAEVSEAEEKGRGRGRRTRGGAKAPEPVNDPGPFLAFVSSHPVGSEVEAVVDRFSSHGAYVVVDGAQGYVPLRLMADPPPRSAREVLTVGETRTFVVAAFDSPRRSIDLAVPGLPATGDSVSDTDTAQEATDMAPAKKSPAKKTAAKKTTAKKAPAKKAAAKKTAAKKAPVKKTAAKKTAAKKATAKKAPAKKTAAKKATAKKAPAKKTAAKKTAAKKTAAKKTTAKKAPARKAARR